MSVNDIIWFAKNNITEFIAIITVLIAVLSQLLVLIEYFRLKGKWDFYYLDDIARDYRRNGFHPEYLVTSLFIVAVMCFVLVNDKMRNVLNNSIIIANVIGILSFVLFASSFIVFYFFSRYDMKKGIYSKREYFITIGEKASFTTIKYFLQLIILYLIYKAIASADYIIVIILLIFSGTMMLFFEYNISKIRTSRNRIFDIICFKDSVYCIISTIDKEKYYMVKARINDNVLYLYLDTRIIVNVEDKEIKKDVFKNIVRIYHGNIIKSKRYYIG